MNKFMKKIMSKKDGFTLVELIVVIAILAILAGVAVPVYSGYIKKANEAGDTQIVSAVNTALAAAATENNIELKDIYTYLTVSDSDNAEMGGVVEIKAQTFTNEGTQKLANEILKDFIFYYGNNSATITFKYYASASIDGDTGNLSTVDPS